MRKTQQKSGKISAVVPTSGFGLEWGNGPAWDAVLAQVCYYVYKYENDIEIVKENFEAIIQNLRYIMSRRNEHGLLAYGLGDWAPPSRATSGYDTELQITDTLITIDTCYKTAKLAEILGELAVKTEVKQYLEANGRRHFLKSERARRRKGSCYITA